MPAQEDAHPVLDDTQTAPAVPPTRALPCRSARHDPADLRQQARAAQQMWMAALKLILSDFDSEAEAKQYLRSVDGRMVLAMAGFDGVQLDRLTLQPLIDRLEVRRDARAKCGDGLAVARRRPVPLDQRERRNGVLKPLPGAVTAPVWAICDELHAAGEAVTLSTVMRSLGAACPAPNSVAGGLVAWRKHHGRLVR